MEREAAAEEELERRSKFLNSLIQRKKAVEQQRHRSGVRVRACDMPAALQDAAFRLSREIIDSMHGGKLDSKRLALTLKKTLSLLLEVMVDVFGRNAQSSALAEASEIIDLVDFLHHVVHYEGQGVPVKANSKPKPEVLALIERACESIRPDMQHLLSHLKPDANSSVYAATHPKIVQNPPAT